MKLLKIMIALALITFSSTAFAQDSANQPVKDTTKPEKAKYSCPMHADVTSGKPGKCPKCGMSLTKSKADQAKIYTCPMHQDVTSNKPGKCAKCNMTLKEKKAG